MLRLYLQDLTSFTRTLTGTACQRARLGAKYTLKNIHVSNYWWQVRGYMDKLLNSYGEQATHADCIHNYDNKCNGGMIWWENINTGNHMLMCERHAWKADNRQYKIKSEFQYYNNNEQDY